METQTLRLKFVREARSGLARLYEDNAGARQWVPVSITKSTVKHPPLTPAHLPIHEVELPEWWIEKNPWPKSRQNELKF